VIQVKILNCFPEATNPNHYAYSNIRSSLLERGCTIVDFDFLGAMNRHGKMGMVSNLRNLIDRERPDIFLHGIVTDEMPVEFLDELRDRNDILSMVFFSDDDWRILNHSIHWVEHYNFATTNDINAVEIYRQAGFNHVFHMQYAANPRIYYPREVPKQYAVTFVGQAYLGRPQMIYQLMMKGIDLRVWGTGWENITELKAISGHSVPTEKMIEIFCASKIVLGLAWCSVPTTNGELMPQIKGRTFEYPACRAFQLTCADNRLSHYFDVGKEIVTYRDVDELVEKIHYYLNHNEEREKIAEAGYQKVSTRHTWRHRWDAFFHFLKERGAMSDNGVITLTAGNQRESIRPAKAAEPLLSGPKPSGASFPLISVYCFVYNREKYIAQTIESVLSQTYQNWEMVILNDGSTDQTETIIKKYQSDPRIKYHYQDNIGQSMNRFHELNNRAIGFTKGEFVCVIGADDIFLPQKLEKQIKEFDLNSDLDISFCNAQMIDHNGRPLPTTFRHPRTLQFNRFNLLRWLFTTNFIAHPSTMIRREAFYKSGYYETGFATDYHFWLKTAQTLNFRFLDEKLWYYRVHEEGMSTAEKFSPICAQATFEVLSEIYEKHSIHDFYPEIRECADQKKAVYSAHLDFGNDMITGQFYRLPFFAIQEYKSALAVRPDGIEALNNLFLAYLKLENFPEVEKALNALRPYASNSEMVARNIAVYENTPADQSLQGQYILLHEQQSELLQKISQVAQNPNLIPGSTLIRKSPNAPPMEPGVLIIQALEEANRFLKEDRPEKAIQLLEDLATRYPDEAVVRAGLGASLLAAGAYPQAITHLQKAADGLPEEIGIHQQLAEAYYLNGQSQEAVQILEKILENFPDNLGALLRLGEIFKAEGQGGNRAAVILKAVNISPLHPEVLVAFGQLGIDSGDQTVFQTAYDKLKEVAPDHNMFKVWDQAFCTSETTLVDRNNSQGQVTGNPLFIPEPRLEQTIPSALTSIVLLLSDDNDHLEECLFHLQAHTTDPYEVLMIGNQKNSEINNWIENHIVDGRKWKLFLIPQPIDSAESHNQGLKMASGDFLVFLSDQVIVTQNWLVDLRETLESKPKVGLVGPMTVNVKGIQSVSHEICQSTKDLDAFSASFKARNRHRRIPARSLNSICVMLKRSLTEIIGFFDETLSGKNVLWEDYGNRTSLEGYQQVIAGDVFVHNYRLQSFESKRKLTAKWSSINSQTDLGKKIVRFNALQDGKTYYFSGEEEKALKTLIDGIKYCPEEMPIYQAMVEILIDAGRFSEGLEALNELPDIFKKDPECLVLYGYCHQGLGNQKGAENYGQWALRLDPDYPPALNLLGLISHKKGDHSAAEEFYRKAIKRDPGYGEPYANLGKLCWQGGEKEEALNWLERGFILSPASSAVIALFQAAINELGTAQRAESHLKSAVTLYPKHKKLSFFLISILLSQGKHQEAMKEIERAMETFGIDDGILSAALDVRDRIGPMEIVGTPLTQGTLSVCMIAKNEEENLLRCLMSLKPIADEIIIVDTGSTDKTKEIARALGAKVFDFKWTNDFSEARNVSLSKASGQWILVHDADEVISSLDYKKLRRLINQTPAQALAYLITTRNYSNNSFLDGWTANAEEYPEEEAAIGWYPTPKVRLYFNDPHIRFQNAVHELLEPSLLKAGYSIIPLDIPIHHYGELNQEKDIAKAETYYALGKKKLTANPDDLKALLELAIQAGELKRYSEAVELFEQYLEKVPRSHLAYFNLATCYLELNKFPQAFRAARHALDLAPDSNEVLLTYAGISFCAGDISEAITILEKLTRKVPDYPVAKASLGAAYYIGGKREEGNKRLTELWMQGFDCHAALHSISEKLIAAHRKEEAKRLLQGMIETKHIHPGTKSLLARLVSLEEKGSSEVTG
jgi:glycosyltransferase involved in cell wall biosynthesis